MRQKKREEEQKEEERRASLRASKIKQYKSYEVFASVIGAQIQLSWVSDIQRKELSPLLRELRAEIRKDKYNTIDWDTDLTKIERAKTKLSSNQTLESIQKELTRRQEQERIERENKERIERENKERIEREKERIEREKERQRREREEQFKAKSMAEYARERIEKLVSTHGNDSNAYESFLEGCLIMFVGLLFIALVVSFFIIIISGSFSDSFGVIIQFASYEILLVILLVIIDKKAKKKHKNTEHFYLWREYPSVIDDIDITEINGEHAIISFSNTAQYLPQQASIRVKRGECFTIKSGSSSINEITIYDDYGIIDFHHSGTLKNLETTTKGTLSPNKDISIWRGRASNIKFKAANDVLLSRVDVVFDSIAESGGEMSIERGRESKLQ